MTGYALLRNETSVTTARTADATAACCSNLSVALILFLLISVPQTTWAQRPVQIAPVSEAGIAELVEQLGSQSFATREFATNQLLKFGPRALPALRSMTTNDIEIRDRAAAIVQRIDELQFQALSKTFLSDSQNKASYDLPSWDTYRTLVGTSRANKILFLDMLREQPELCNQIERAARLAESDLESSAEELSRLRQMLTKSSSELAGNLLAHHQTPEIGDIVGILLGTTLLKGQAPIEVNQFLGNSTHMIPATTYLRRKGYSDSLKMLYGLWIPKTHDGMAYSSLAISMREGLDSGAIIARRNLGPHLDSTTRESAILCVAEFGNPSDIPSLLELFDDETLCHEFEKPQTTPRFDGIEESNEAPPGFPPSARKSIVETKLVRYRICDLALAACLVISGDRLEQVFAHYPQSSDRRLVSRGVVVDATDEKLQERRLLLDDYRQKFHERISKP